MGRNRLQFRKPGVFERFDDFRSLPKRFEDGPKDFNIVLLFGIIVHAVDALGAVKLEVGRVRALGAKYLIVAVRDPLVVLGVDLVDFVAIFVDCDFSVSGAKKRSLTTRLKLGTQVNDQIRCNHWIDIDNMIVDDPAYVVDSAREATNRSKDEKVRDARTLGQNNRPLACALVNLVCLLDGFALYLDTCGVDVSPNQCSSMDVLILLIQQVFSLGVFG